MKQKCKRTDVAIAGNVFVLFVIKHAQNDVLVGLCQPFEIVSVVNQRDWALLRLPHLVDKAVW